MTRLDRNALDVMGAAQAEAEKRGGKFVVSGLLLLAAAQTGRGSADAVLQALGVGRDALAAEVDSEWTHRASWRLDDPLTVVRDAVVAAIAEIPEGKAVSIELVLAKCLAFENSMASRVVERLTNDREGTAARLAAP